MPITLILLSIPLWAMLVAVIFYSKTRNKTLEQEHKDTVADIKRIQKEMRDWFQG